MLRFLPTTLIAPLALALLTLSATSGCFYDSSWGARKTAQIHNAARATPASLSPPAATTSASRSSASSSGTGAALHVRVHATPAYAAQTPDWKTHFGALLAEAGATLEASVGASLILETTDSWNHVAGDRLEGDLAALRVEDTGEGVDLVVGLIGGLPMLTQSFEKLGMSEVRGKHLVVRAPNVASEYDAVEKAFDELSAKARASLRQKRIRHREVAVLLHEIGHALGAGHATSEGSLMRPTYDPKMSAFDPESIARMRGGLARAGEALGPDGSSAPRAARSTPEVASAPPPAPEPAADPPAELAPADGERWRRASALAKAGDAERAWHAARPMFASYPLVYGVQDLRCKLAMAALTSFADVRVECDPLMNLTMKGAK